MRNKRSVLVIEDDPDVAEIIERVLKHAGDTVVVATNGPDGVALARSAQLDLILCDHNMPGMTGSEVVAILKNDPATAHIPIVSMSGNSVQLPMEVEGYLPKPFHPQELRELLNTIVPERRDTN